MYNRFLKVNLIVIIHHIMVRETHANKFGILPFDQL